MSVESIAIALHHSRATGAAKLVLVGIANHDGDGGSWPSIATLSRYAGIAPRNVQMALAKLVKLGEVERIVMGGGTHNTADHMRPNLYRFLVRCPPSCDRTTQHRREGRIRFEMETDPLTLASPPVAGVTGGVTLASPEPSITTPRKSDIPARRVLNRATGHGHGQCGHALVDDRHCVYGCANATRALA